MSKNGWISIYRDLQEHWLWQEKREFSKLEAWFDILLTVNHADQKVMIKNTLYEVKRGESIKCLETWGKRWNWNKSKVRRFFILLQEDGMITTKNETKTTRLTVCKYDSYQQSRNADETQVKQTRNADETQATPNNNDNNINNPLYFQNESEFLNIWNAARIKLNIAKHSNFNTMYVDEKENFDFIKTKFTIEEFKDGMRGLFMQKDMFPSNLARPKHFLSDMNIEKYIDAHKNNKQLYENKNKYDVKL